MSDNAESPSLAAVRPLGQRRARLRELPEDARPEVAVLESLETGVGLAVTAAERSVWNLADGTRTLRELLAAALLEPEPVGPREAMRTLVRFGRAGLMEHPILEEASPAPLVSFRLPVLGDGGRRLAGALAAALAIAPLAGLPYLLGFLKAGGLALVPPGASPWTALALLWGLVWVRWLGQACTAMACGFGLVRAGADLTLLVPLPWLDLMRLDVASRRHQVYVALAGLSGPIAAGCAVALWARHAGGEALLASQAAALGLLATVFDASPLFELNGYRLYRAVLGQALVRERALAYLAHRFLVQARAPDTDAREERQLAVYGFAVVLWLAGCLKLATVTFRQSVVPVMMAVFGSGSWPVQTALLGLLFVCGALLVWAIVRVLLVPVRLLGEHARREMVSRLAVPAAVLASAMGLLWHSETGQLALYIAYAALAGWAWYRYRPVFRGTPILPGVDLVVLVLGARAALLLPPMLLSAIAVFLGAEVIQTRQMAADGMGALLLLAAPFFATHAWRVGLTKAELGICGALALFLASLLPLGAAGGAPAGALLNYAGTIACAIGFSALILVDAKGPAARVWRLFHAGFIAFSAGATVELLSGSDVAIHQVSLPLATAGLLPLAAAHFVASTIFAAPLRGRERRAPAAGSAGLETAGAEPGPTQACCSATNHLFGTLTDVAADVLGQRRARAVLAESLWAASEADPTGVALGWDLRLAALERHGGRDFRLVAEHAATTGLYWLEWEAANRDIFPAGSDAIEPERLTAMLGDIPLFALLSQDERRRVAALLRNERATAGQQVVGQGEPGGRFYVVLSGELDVWKTEPSGHAHRVGRLSPGDCFGELALLETGVRTASVRARRESMLASMGREDFLATFSAETREHAAVTALIRHGGFLRRVPIFSRLPAPMLWRLAARLTPRSCPAGQVLRAPGAPAGQLFLVRQGVLEATGPDGSRTVLGEGGHWGERLLLGADLSSGTLACLEASELLLLEPGVVERELDQFLAGLRTADDVAGEGGTEWLES